MYQQYCYQSNVEQFQDFNCSKRNWGRVAELLQGCFCSPDGPFHVSSDVNALPTFQAVRPVPDSVPLSAFSLRPLLSSAPYCLPQPAYILTGAKFTVTSSWCFSLFSVWGASLSRVLLRVDRSHRRFFFFLQFIPSQQQCCWQQL